MTAPRFPTTATGDGTTKDFQLSFPILDKSHVRVFQNGVLKTITTDYVILDTMLDGPDGGRLPLLRFNTAPTNGHALKFYRNTPIGVGYRPTLVIGNLQEKLARYRQEEALDARLKMDYYFNATDLATPTAQQIVAPCDGYIEALTSDVCDAAISTGGGITVEVDGVTVIGLAITVANSAAIGVHQEDTPTTPQSATTQVRRGQIITVTPGAAFNGGGAVRGRVELQPADL